MRKFKGRCHTHTYATEHPVKVERHQQSFGCNPFLEERLEAAFRAGNHSSIVSEKKSADNGCPLS